ncbi:MAG: hypothetical protein V4697_02825 [Patescibacteria group bacterium]
MKEINVIYNRYGAPVLRLLSDWRLVSFSGKNIGFIKGENLFNYSGEYVGWIQNDVMRDRDGYVVGFGEKPIDYPAPLFPFKQLKPFPGFVELAPLRPLTQHVPLKPLKSFSWSQRDPISLFFQ